MTEISEAAKRKARELIDAGAFNHAGGEPVWIVVLARVLQEHSDVARVARDLIASDHGAHHAEFLQSLILPEEPDWLETICTRWEMEGARIVDGKAFAKSLRTALAERGLKIVEEGDD